MVEKDTKPKSKVGRKRVPHSRDSKREAKMLAKEKVKEILDKTQKSKYGQHKKNIDWDLVDTLLKAGCSGCETAAAINVSDQCLYQRCEKDKGMKFGEYRNKLLNSGNSILKLAQFNLAVQELDVKMLIHLGKHRLGQIEKQEIIGKMININPVELAKKEPEKAAEIYQDFLNATQVNND